MAAKRRSTQARRAPMDVALRARGVDVDAELRDYIAKRAGFKLGKFAAAIERITVRLEDIAGPKGAPAKRCAIKVVLPHQGSAVVEVLDDDARAAFDHCIDAVERAVRRTIEKSQAKKRRRPA